MFHLLPLTITFNWFIPFVVKRVSGRQNFAISRQRVPYLSTYAMRLPHKKTLYQVSLTYSLPLLFHVNQKHRSARNYHVIAKFDNGRSEETGKILPLTKHKATTLSVRVRGVFCAFCRNDFVGVSAMRHFFCACLASFACSDIYDTPRAIL